MADPTAAENERHFWDQLPGENDKHYEIFCRYRDYGRARSLDKVWRAQFPPDGPQQKQRHPSQWDLLSRRWQWLARAAAYDAHIEQKVRVARESAVVEVEADTWAKRRTQQANQMWDLGKALLDKAKEMLQFPLATIQQETRREIGTDENGVVQILHTTNIVYPGKWTMRDAGNLADIAAKLMQAATGGIAEAEPGGGAGDSLAAEAQPMLQAMHDALDRADDETRDEILNVYERMMTEARRLQDLVNTTNVAQPALPGIPAGGQFVPDADHD